eukprot:1138294-Pelagomonas_calceolata.AAC.3
MLWAKRAASGALLKVVSKRLVKAEVVVVSTASQRLPVSNALPAVCCFFIVYNSNNNNNNNNNLGPHVCLERVNALGEGLNCCSLQLCSSNTHILGSLASHKRACHVRMYLSIWFNATCLAYAHFCCKSALQAGSASSVSSAH